LSSKVKLCPNNPTGKPTYSSGSENRFFFVQSETIFVSVLQEHSSPVRNVAVFCGSKPGIHPVYAVQVLELANLLHENGFGIVYGGGNVGLMGILADCYVQLGGQVTGVIPSRLVEWEVAHQGLSELHVVADMHERKALMARLSCAFVVLPGGIGTLEELFEVFAWQQLGYHSKPIYLLNTAGFYDGLVSFLKQLTENGFLDKEQLARLQISDVPANIVESILCNC